MKRLRAYLSRYRYQPRARPQRRPRAYLALHVAGDYRLAVTS